MSNRLLVSLSFAIAVTACAPHPEQFSTSLSATPDGHRYLQSLFEDEIGQANVRTAEEAIRRLRPSFLLARPAAGREGRGVYLDGFMIGGLEQLRGIPALVIHEIRVLSAVEAFGRYTVVPPGGLIIITTKFSPRPR